MKPSGKTKAALLALVAAMMFTLSGCPNSDGGGSGGGYHLHR